MVLRMNNKGFSGFIKISMILICISAFTLISAASASDDVYNVYCDWVSESGGSCCVIVKTTDPRSPALSSQEFSGGVSYSRAIDRLTELTGAGLGRDCEYGIITQADNTLWNVYCDWGSDSGGSCCVVQKTTDPRSAALNSQEFPRGVTYRRAMERLTELTSAGLGRDCEYGTSTQADNTRWSIFCERSIYPGRPGVDCCVVAKTTDPPSTHYILTEFPAGVPFNRAMGRLSELTITRDQDYCGSGAATPPTPTRYVVPTISITPRATATPDSGDNPIAIIQAIIGGIIQKLTGWGDNAPPGPGPTQITTVVPTTHATLKRTVVPTTTPTIKRTVVPTTTPTPCENDDAACEWFRKVGEEATRR
jgi:hypothetical protein